MLNKIILSAAGILLIASASASAAQQFHVCNKNGTPSNLITLTFQDGSTSNLTANQCFSHSVSGKNITFNIASTANQGSCSVTIPDLSNPAFTANGSAGFCMPNAGTLTYNSNVAFPTFDVNLG